MPWVDSATNDQRLAAMPNPVGFIWEENHPAHGPPGWDAQLYWPWVDVRMLLTFIPARMRSVPDRAVVLMYIPANQPPPLANPLGLRPASLHRLMSYCCGAAHANSCPIGERLVGACSHCTTLLTLSTVLPANPAEFSTTHRGTRLLDRRNPLVMDIATTAEVSNYKIDLY